MTMPVVASTRLTVLVVDDEPGMRALVKRCLEAEFEIVEAANAADALALEDSLRRLGLLITDEMMPEMEGHELARRFRINDPDLKVLYLTGYADQLFKEKITLWEDEAFLDKPCSVKGLLQAVSLLFFNTLDLPKSN